jgi:arylsulfatase A-like enzyme
MRKLFFERVVFLNLGCILCSAATQPVELFNLKTDPQQTRNLAAEHPEKVEELKKLLSQLEASGRTRPE